MLNAAKCVITLPSYLEVLTCVEVKGLLGRRVQHAAKHELTIVETGAPRGTEVAITS